MADTAKDTTVPEYRKGDATRPDKIPGNKAIIHIVNDCVPPRWGKGFVLALSRRWKDPETWHRDWASRGEIDGVKFSLGKIQVIHVEKDIVVVNMVSQHGIGLNRDGRPPIRYDALESCLEKVCKFIDRDFHPCTVVGPKFGAGLAGGNWETIEGIVVRKLCSRGIPVVIFSP